jgi:hypothetical protein
MKWLVILALSAVLAGCSSARVPNLEDTGQAGSLPPGSSQPDSTQLGSSEPSPSPPISLGQPIALTGEQKADVEKSVKNKLADPGSARFGTMNAVVSRKTTKGYIVCGWVSTQHNDGGNAGDQPFIALYDPKLRIALLLGIGGGEADAHMVRTQCISEGVPLGA